MTEGSERITVIEIFNQTYHVRSAGSEDHIKELARFVDERMREVSSLTPTVDSLKVAVLAALNIADRFFATRQKLDELEKTVTERSDKLSDLLEPVLNSKSP